MKTPAIDWRNLPVHPLAARFPMMDDEELAELAEDIRINGLQEPIIIGEWQDGDRKITGLIDGRNRRKACELAEVEAQVRRLDGEDTTAFIVSLNIERRHLTPGQRAMLYAIAYPNPEQRGRGHKSIRGVSIAQPKVSMARTIYHGAPDWVDLVLAGAKSLDEGVAEARQRSAEAGSEEIRMVRLRQYAPDVAQLVEAQKISLAAGLEELTERDRRRQQTIDAGRRALGQISSFAAQVLSIQAAREQGEPLPITADQMGNIRQAVDLIERLYAEQGGRQ